MLINKCGIKALVSTQDEKQQGLESSSSDKQMMQVELDTHIQENTSQGEFCQCKETLK